MNGESGGDMSLDTRLYSRLLQGVHEIVRWYNSAQRGRDVVTLRWAWLEEERSGHVVSILAVCVIFSTSIVSAEFLSASSMDNKMRQKHQQQGSLHCR